MRPHRLQPTRLPRPWDSPGKNTGVGCHALLQGIFPTQGSNLGLPYHRQILDPLSHQGAPLHLPETECKSQVLHKAFPDTVSEQVNKLFTPCPPLCYNSIKHYLSPKLKIKNCEPLRLALLILTTCFYLAGAMLSPHQGTLQQALQSLIHKFLYNHSVILYFLL